MIERGVLRTYRERGKQWIGARTKDLKMTATTLQNNPKACPSCTLVSVSTDVPCFPSPGHSEIGKKSGVAATAAEELKLDLTGRGKKKKKKKMEGNKGDRTPFFVRVINKDVLRGTG